MVARVRRHSLYFRFVSAEGWDKNDLRVYCWSELGIFILDWRTGTPAPTASACADKAKIKAADYRSRSGRQLQWRRGGAMRWQEVLVSQARRFRPLTRAADT